MNTQTQPNHDLENVSMWLFRNEQGYHVTITTNYNTPNYKKRFFSLAGERCRNQWRAFNTDQPPKLKPYFADIKEKWEPKLDQVNCNFRISKLAVNTGSNGRKTGPGAIFVFETDPTWIFTLYLGPLKFEGEFNSDGLSDKQVQQGCQGFWTWKQEVQDEDEAW